MALLERLTELMPTAYAYVLLYLVAKARERGENTITVNYSVLGAVMGLTKASAYRCLKRLDALNFLKVTMGDHHRVTVHVYNIAEIKESVKLPEQERNVSETETKQERDASETNGPPSPVPLSSPTLSDSLTSTPTPGAPPIIPPRNYKFVKPSPEHVADYAKSLGYKLDGSLFCDFYESKGWLIGKSPMKSWKAAVRTWKKQASPEDMIRPPLPKKHEPVPEKTPETHPEEFVSQEDVHALVVKLAGGSKL